MPETERAVKHFSKEFEQYKRRIEDCPSNWPAQKRTLEALANYYWTALAALRAQLAREKPKPLTPEQLRERVGKPIWISGIKQWGVLGRKGIDADDDGNPIFRYVVGFAFAWEWLDDVLRGREAYDYPPKETTK